MDAVAELEKLETEFPDWQIWTEDHPTASAFFPLVTRWHARPRVQLVAGWNWWYPDPEQAMSLARWRLVWHPLEAASAATLADEIRIVSLERR